MEPQKVIAENHARKLDSMITETASTTTDLDSEQGEKESRITHTHHR